VLEKQDSEKKSLERRSVAFLFSPFFLLSCIVLAITSNIVGRDK
jgi:hypothetical protein